MQFYLGHHPRHVDDRLDRVIELLRLCESFHKRVERAVVIATAKRNRVCVEAYFVLVAAPNFDKTAAGELEIQDDEGAFHDIDTPAEYEAVLAKLTARDR